jgi:hypothetical protein
VSGLLFPVRWVAWYLIDRRLADHDLAELDAVVRAHRS